MIPRLPAPYGTRIDRSETLTFTFEGKAFRGLAGDSIASALVASGQWLISRSFKYHRPRSVLTMAGQDANTLVQVAEEPNVLADVYPLREGLEATAQNVNGSLDNDRDALLDRLGRFMPVGFYYRTFFGPGKNSWLRLWEPLIRKKAGLGKVDVAAPRARYEKQNRFYDVLVVGGGPAGMSAAIQAAAAGARVLLVDENPELGGSLTYARFDDKPEATALLLRDLKRQVEAHSGIDILTNAVANGWYADNWVPIISGNRLLKVRAKEVILCTGSLDQPVPFRNNDLPGIVLGSAAQRLMRHYAVKPGRRAVVLAGNRDGYRVALDLIAAGVEVAAVVDPRSAQQHASLAEDLAAKGVRIIMNATVAEAAATAGNKHLKAAKIASAGSGTSEWIDCDLLSVSCAYTPTYQLALQAGAKLSYDDGAAQFALSNVPAHLTLAGSVAGNFSLPSVLAAGRKAGAVAAKTLGLPGRDIDVPKDDERGVSSFELPLVGHPKGRDFVDFDEDLQIKDIVDAVRTGYSELELVKRFSTVGMGPSQGRHSALATARIVAHATERKVADIGVTTSRPPFGPEKLGLLAGLQQSRYRHTSVHHRHIEAGAKMTPVGAWWRPLYYGDERTRDELIVDEVNLVRQRVGMLDVSTLGKIELRGPDAGVLLDRFCTMNYAKQPVGRVRYCLTLNEMGSVIDDGVAFRIAEDHYYVTATTGGVDRFYADMCWQNVQWGLDVDIHNVTAGFAAFNLTGPLARQVLETVGGMDASSEALPFLGGRVGRFANCPVRIMRIGYSGELSFELHTPQSYGEALWDALMDAGRPFGLRPYGLEASRILRLEKGHIIIGQDTDAVSTADELGMEWALAMKKPFFIGKRSIELLRRLPAKRRLVGFELPASVQDKPDEACLILRGDEAVGHVTSTCLSPTLGKWIGLAFAPADQAEPGKTAVIRTRRGTQLQARIVSPHFFDPENKRQDI
ncbi:FAD-dependent oxidoreductase [Bradyrhizobium iriomotense]|uniref:Aminomethyltransferase n=1 Tax=Bradyrhizobium iriomotense TaxID=441950 RepID=A0ABQ6BE91_9BRAD|nr:FAD-dependent oxidoreductase [Bradyrhizobium iriomotense]GLR91846.1 aminomethyltransferase [Bradyrhizobium iriomotense]